MSLARTSSGYHRCWTTIKNAFLTQRVRSLMMMCPALWLLLLMLILKYCFPINAIAAAAGCRSGHAVMVRCVVSHQTSHLATVRPRGFTSVTSRHNQIPRFVLCFSPSRTFTLRCSCVWDPMKYLTHLNHVVSVTPCVVLSDVERLCRSGLKWKIKHHRSTNIYFNTAGQHDWRGVSPASQQEGPEFDSRNRHGAFLWEACCPHVCVGFPVLQFASSLPPKHVLLTGGLTSKPHIWQNKFFV